jgi:hypothetical protein
VLDEQFRRSACRRYSSAEFHSLARYSAKQLSS